MCTAEVGAALTAARCTLARLTWPDPHTGAWRASHRRVAPQRIQSSTTAGPLPRVARRAIKIGTSQSHCLFAGREGATCATAAHGSPTTQPLSAHGPVSLTITVSELPPSDSWSTRVSFELRKGTKRHVDRDALLKPRSFGASLGRAFGAGQIDQVDLGPALSPLRAVSTLNGLLLRHAQREDGVRTRRAGVHLRLTCGPARVAVSHQPRQLLAIPDGHLNQPFHMHPEGWVLLDLKRLGGRRAIPLASRGRAPRRRTEEVM
eukprot:scaffold266160_cov26-Tisochrysis_lutea.AAC.1